MQIPLGISAYQRSDGLVPEARLLNMVLEADGSGLSPDKTMRVQRPGLLSLYTLSGPVRGMNYRAETAEGLTVAGGLLYSGTEAKGTIAGDDNAAMVDTTFTHAILGGGVVYLYNGSTLTTLAIPDINSVPQTPVDVDQLNQYVIIQCASGAFFWLVPGETTLDALNFATAESSPDRARAVRRVGDEFAIFSDDSVEFWQATGDIDAPFQRVTGRSYERGCLDRDSVRRFDNTLIWVDADSQVCKGGAVPQVVSDNGISERIRKRIADTSAWVFSHDGHEYYCLNIPGEGTFVFDALTSQWSEWASPDVIGWEPTKGYDFRGEIFAGGSSGKVYGVSAAHLTDDGVPFERLASATVGFMGLGVSNVSFSVGVGCSSECQIRLRWRDGQETFPDYYDIWDALPEFDVANYTRLGLPRQPYREWELSVVDPVRVRFAGATANESRG